MQRMQSGKLRSSIVSALLLGGVLLVASSAFADPRGEPDLPSTKLPPTPRSINQEIKLADDYFVGRDVTQDLKMSAYWYQKAAEAGDPTAQLQTGYFYEAGIGVSKDLARAAHWYQLAASSGLVGAKVSLGVAYLWGSGVPKNPEVAAQLFREAASEGSGLAAKDLGTMYFNGIGVPQDKRAAEQWYLKGAKRHNPQAEYDLGLLFFDGEDHVHDLRAAATLLRDSAAAGDVPAMYSLGLLLARNPALAKSKQEAIQLLNDSSSGGIWMSSMILGELARDGNGVPADSNAAYYHFRVAVLQGGEPVKKLLANDLRILSTRLSPSQTQATDAQAEEWCQHHHIVLEFVYKGENPAGFPAYALTHPENGEHVAQLLATMPKEKPDDNALQLEDGVED
jgi:uncharacterized protein